MSSSFGYLIPSKNFEVGQFKKQITSVLEAEEVIEGYYDEKYSWFAAGANSYFIFDGNNEDGNPAFEYVEIHDNANTRIVPDCTEEPYGGKCKNCKAIVDEDLSIILIEVADMEFDNESETDMAQLTVQCHNCGHTNKITEIDYESSVRFKNQFLCFVEINFEFDNEKIWELGNKLDCTFEIIYGRF